MLELGGHLGMHCVMVFVSKPFSEPFIISIKIVITGKCRDNTEICEQFVNWVVMEITGLLDGCVKF